jgi:hypothetical protein
VAGTVGVGKEPHWSTSSSDGRTAYVTNEDSNDVNNEARTLHNLSIPAFGIDRDIPPQGQVQVDVTFPASGVLVFSRKFHGPLGMNGRLLASDAAPSEAR